MERLPIGLFLQHEPPGAIDLAIVCEQANEGSLVLLAARVAEGDGAFAADRAEFQLLSSDPGASATATLRVTGPRGRTMRSPLLGEQGLAPGVRVVVEGTLSTKDDTDGHVIDAVRIYVAAE